MRKFGLIGYPLSHSFSKKYFTEKFTQENIRDAVYEIYEIENIRDFPTFLKQHPGLRGLNVTTPHKETVIPFLDQLGDSAQRVGAVNVIKIDHNDKLIGYNSDYYGFLQSLSHELSYLKNLHSLEGYSALVLGTGGASKAVGAALEALEISYTLVSRSKKKTKAELYENLNERMIRDNQLIINTTPLGTYPNTETYPDIPYQYLTPQHFLYDLVYNPAETLFLKKGKEQGTRIKSGLEMLHLQAEKAWEIWNN